MMSGYMTKTHYLLFTSIGKEGPLRDRREYVPFAFHLVEILDPCVHVN